MTQFESPKAGGNIYAKDDRVCVYSDKRRTILGLGLITSMRQGRPTEITLDRDGVIMRLNRMQEIGCVWYPVTKEMVLHMVKREVIKRRRNSLVRVDDDELICHVPSEVFRRVVEVSFAMENVEVYIDEPVTADELGGMVWDYIR